MALDPNEMTQCGLTEDQSDVREAQYVREANDALAELRNQDGRWWLYSVSHRTFEVVIGGPFDRDNVVIALSGCDHIAGPVTWPNQQLRVVFHSDQLASVGCMGVYVLEDESVGFKATGAVFRWQRGYDLLEHRSLYMPRSRSGSGGNDICALKVKELIELIELDDWLPVHQKGSHRQFYHPTKPGTVTISGKLSIDVPPSTLNSALRSADL